MIKLSINEINKVEGGNNNDTWIDEHPWETAAIIAGSVLTITTVSICLIWKLPARNDQYIFLNTAQRMRYPV